MQILSLDTWNNPRELEGKVNLPQYRGRLGSPKMAAGVYSSMVNTPINCVLAGGTVGDIQYDEKTLTDMYLENQIINLDSITSENIVSCHQEIPIQFKTYR